MEEQVKKVKKFIEDNRLDFSSSGSELNGNCTTLAGFICYILDEDPDFNYSSDGHNIITDLDFSADSEEELRRVFEKCLS